MATAHGSTTHLSTGPMSAAASTSADELKEYQRILKISDEIFTGTHPRLKVPQQFVRKTVTRSNHNESPSLPAARRESPGNLVDGGEPVKVAETDQNSRAPPVESKAPTRSNLNAAAPSFRMAPKAVSEIDPIFLTKSEDLVRAEIQLQRQRVERTLRDQLEQRKHESKQKPAIQDTTPGFDVSDVLARALEIVQPVSLSETSEPTGPNDSFDDNSFYSSRAPDSPQPAGGHRKPSPVAAPPLASAPSQAIVEAYEDELQRLEALNRTESDQEMHDAYPVVDQSAHQLREHFSPRQPQPRDLQSKAQSPDVLEEPEYSPPAPVAPPPTDHARYAQRTLTAGAMDSSMDRVTVVRNHITSPAAPQPSHVSPLATTKLSSAQQRRAGHSDLGLNQLYSDPDSGREGLGSAVPPVSSRKRRKIQASGEKRVVSPKNQTSGSIDAPIKLEPVSPPPFADDPAIRSGRQVQERPVYIDIASPQYTSVVERREPSARGPVYELNHYGPEYAVDHSTQRSVSGLGERRAVREDSNLRRVVTTQYVRQSDQATGYGGGTEPRVSRATSYAVTERPSQESTRYYEELPSSHRTRYITVDDGRHSVYQEPYYEEAAPVRLIAAPERRFVVDELGNRYEMVPAPSVQPMAPPPRPMSRALKPETYHEHLPSRTASVRAASVLQDPYGEHRYVQEMPPPPPTYRRVVSDYGRPVATERRVFTAPMDIHDRYVPSETVPVAEYVSHRPAYADDHGPTHERVIRTTSVRPPPARYEEPLEVIQRVSSVHPGVSSRAVSVFADERPRGQYIERPYYIREQRYYETDDGNRMALDGPADTAPRVQPRY